MEPIFRVLKQAAIRGCDHFILDPDHYGEEGCRCSDPDHEIMSDWGYEWNGERWIAPAE
jgi:hypothetical protein